MLTCARCGQENPAGASFCNACGAPLAEPSGTREERRVVSIVFVDLVGFTARSEKLDPEDVRAILAAGPAAPSPTPPGQPLPGNLPTVPTRDLDSYRTDTLKAVA